ncbi:MAG: PEP-utilizing enzyme [Patescibacteria group bacterium]|jgi:phosphohistidine swiveling domain-containing protein
MQVDLKNKKWVYYGVSAYPMYLHPFLEAPSHSFYALYGASCDGAALWHGKNCDWLYDEKQLLGFSEAVLPSLLENKWAKYDEWYKLAEEFEVSHTKLMAQDLTKLTDGDLRSLADEYYRFFLTQYSKNNWIEPLSIYFQEKLRQILASENLSPSQVDDLVAEYSRPVRDNYLKTCAKELVTELDSLASLVAKYHYINNDYTGPKTVSENDIKALAATTSLVEEKATSRLELKSNIKDLLCLLQITATIQDVRKAYSLMWVSGVHFLVGELASRFGFSIDNLRFAFWDEIWQKDVDLGSFKDRTDGMVAYYYKNGRDIVTGQEAEKIRQNFEHHIVGIDTDMKEVKGIGASGGKIRGRVCNVTNLSHFNKVKPGDVLVTQMTRPEYLPLMRLASAFVTDEGGLTCHAAIVSREMGKPCVIATKIGTKFFKDGDLVEVDGDKGVVTKIS